MSKQICLTVRPLLIIVSMCLPCLTAIAQPPETPSVVGETEQKIDQDVNAFVNAINEKNKFNAPFYVEGARLGLFGCNEWMSYQNFKFEVEKIRLEKLDGDNAQVTVIYRDKQPFAGDTTLHDTLSLHTQGNLWCIVVKNPEDALAKDRASLGRMALFVKQPPGIIPIIRSEESLSRLKQLGLGCLQLTQDFDETFNFDADYAREALLPYVKSEALFLIPGTMEKYTFNNRLSGLHMEKLFNPAQTVLFYEGTDEHVVFRYNGKAAVGFVDGHVALVGREETKKVRWEP